jgi:hypothetical protein
MDSDDSDSDDDESLDGKVESMLTQDQFVTNSTEDESFGKRGHDVFENLMFLGVANNMKKVDKAYPYIIKKVSSTDSKNAPSQLSDNGGFVLCELHPKQA